MHVTVHVPATTANLGPGFDCLGLALDVWNQARFRIAGEGVRVSTAGFGAKTLPADERNLIARAFRAVCQHAGVPFPPGLQIKARNSFPIGSGLGSSAAAVVAGVVGANALLGRQLSEADLLDLAAKIEGHPDNVTPALLGGLTLSVSEGGTVLARKVAVAAVWAAVVVPDFALPTIEARAALPQQVALSDAVFNLGRTALVVEALRTGDWELLAQAMADRLHQPYRLKLIPGATRALEAARQAGAAAALSGAGPGMVALTPDREQARTAAEAMREAFAARGLQSWARITQISQRGAGFSTQ